jgi:hypothetical protein
MPAKKNPPTDKPVKPVATPAKPAAASAKKSAPVQAKTIASVKPIKTAKPVEKPAVKKAAPVKKKPAPVAKPVEKPAPASEPVASLAAPVAPVATLPELSTPAPVPAPAAVVAPAPVQPAPAPSAPPVRPMVPPQPYSSGMRKPDLFQAIAVMTLVNGILNILLGLGLTAGVVLGTFFFGLLCAPLTILPLILGIFEILYAIKLLGNPPQQVKPSQAIAILEIVAVLYGNVISLAVGVLALVFYSDANVKAYFARINGQA